MVNSTRVESEKCKKSAPQKPEEQEGVYEGYPLEAYYNHIIQKVSTNFNALLGLAIKKRTILVGSHLIFSKYLKSVSPVIRIS